jgi:hypothetical protein
MRPEPTRRRVLGAFGTSMATAVTAGCLSDGGPGDGTPEGRDTPNDGTPIDATPTDASDDVTVRDATVRPEVVTLDSPDAYGTFGARDEQYLVVEVAVASPDARPPSAFAVETPGGTYDVTTEAGVERTGHLAGFGRAYDRSDDGTGWLVALLPKPLDAGSVALTWKGGEHVFGASVRERLAQPPARFEPTLDAPSAASVGDDVTATVTVENTADVDGTFVGALNRAGPLVAYAPEADIALEVLAGGTVEWTFTHTLDDPEAEGRPMRFHLEWRDGNPSREVQVEEE